MILLYWPSILGWHVVFNCIPIAFYNPLQNWEVNFMSLSEIIDKGTPCNVIISWTCNLLRISKESVDLTSKKWADLVNLTIIIHILSWCFRVLVSSLTKFTLTCSHLHSNTERDWSNLADFWCFAFTCGQIKHLATNYPLSLFIPFHHKYLCKFWYIFVLSGYMINLDL